MTSPLALPIAYLDGQFLSVDKARISPLDRGFIFGDGVYEFIPVYQGKPIRIAEHLERLQKSLDAIEITNPHSTPEWIELITKLIARNRVPDVGVYLQITRGVAKRDFGFPAESTPTVFMMANPLMTPTAEQYAKGLSCISLDDIRWQRCDIKSVSLLGAVLLKNAALKSQHDDCLLFRKGYLKESSSSNVVAIMDGIILCPPMNSLILAGVTYVLMIELARQAGIPVEVRPVSKSEVVQADELWMTSSTKNVMAITQLDDCPVGKPEYAGKPGPLFWRMHALFEEYKRGA